jgi:hypothetical protein
MPQNNNVLIMVHAIRKEISISTRERRKEKIPSAILIIEKRDTNEKQIHLFSP